MDQDVMRFRETADRENGARRGERRRYSLELQEQAVAYWQKRRAHEGLRTIAAALGVAPWTLRRWTRGVSRRGAFRPITVIAPPPAVTAVSVAVTMTAAGPRVEGLSVDAAARLLTLLR